MRDGASGLFDVVSPYSFALILSIGAFGLQIRFAAYTFDVGGVGPLGGLVEEGLELRRAGGVKHRCAAIGEGLAKK